ncbi:MAG: Eco57I restriction-modification methylase domain-containing protein, partial [Anaerolineae bacterium]|nr:Eco57I restriction-modification methylase domain-containing protein [Anaerolineae bacterium]
YIVRFIVEKTLEPLLTEITSQFAELDQEGHWQVHDPEGVVRAILGLNVLDPATGSGHFVVDVTAYIAEWLRDLGLRISDIGEEDELIYWKRQVASACIYAVDINPLAVELAKLSMWLTTLAKGRPLSFLDHHIRVGNSLVGTSFFDMQDQAVSVKEEERRRKSLERQRQYNERVGQLTLFSEDDFTAGVKFAVAQMHEIEATIADHVRDVKHQEELYAALTQRLSSQQQAADVWTARYFGLSLTDEQWKAVRQLTTGGMISPAVQEIVDEAERIAQEQRFFHWELVFPEIFFDETGRLKENAGFDAVVGNPPYVRQEHIQPIKRFLQSHYAVYSGTADLFLYFYERGLEFLKREHRLGFITSGTYMNSNSAKPFRQYIHANAAFDTLVDFGAVQPFRGVDLPTNVMVAVLKPTDDRTIFRSLLIEGKTAPTALRQALDKEGFDTLQDVSGYEEWRFQPKQLTELFYRLTYGRPLLPNVTRGIAYGIKTGFNDAFFIDEKTRQELLQADSSSAEIIKPLARGQDLRPWYQSNGGQYLIFTRQGIEIEQYPAIKAYLEQYKEALEPKPATWDESRDGTWNGRKSGPYRWYEIQDQVAYHREFEGPKILFPDIAKYPRFSWDTGGLYCNDKGSIILTDRTFLLAILNSRTIWFVIGQIATPLAIRQGLWRYQAKLQFIERLPVPELTTQQESNLTAIAEEITSLARERYQLHEDMRQILSADFGDGAPISSRITLYEWWALEDDRALSDELKRQFRTEIPLNRRSEWRRFLAEQQAEHQRLTDAIIAQEIRLNDIVYDAFDLTPEERQLIEETTKYPYGEV